jgi:hypothetical protein
MCLTIGSCRSMGAQLQGARAWVLTESGAGSAWGPVILPVFKTGARQVRPVVGAFDSHTLPPNLNPPTHGQSGSLAVRKLEDIKLGCIFSFCKSSGSIGH